MLANFMRLDELGAGAGSIVERDAVPLISGKGPQPDSVARRNFPEQVMKHRVFHVKESYLLRLWRFWRVALKGK
jgi:hypothetical protein